MSVNLSQLSVFASSRIHLGLLQLSEHYSTSNMGFGFALERPGWILNVKQAKTNFIEKSELASDVPSELISAAYDQLTRICSITNGPQALIEIISSVPAHVGLGSKTSLFCAITAAYATLVDYQTNWEAFRQHTLRGGTSGIGINLGLTGGIILDCGHYEQNRCRIIAPSAIRAGQPFPSIAARWELPQWPVVIATLQEVPRIHGYSEAKIFQDCTPISKEEADKVSGVGLYELIPAVVAQDYHRFTEAISALQRVGFKKHEWLYQHPEVLALRDVALQNGADAVALSSMGPTLAIFHSNPSRLMTVLEDAGFNSLSLILTFPRNSGLEIKKLSNHVRITEDEIQIHNV